MQLSRRALLRLIAASAALPAAARMTWAQAYPVRPVRIIVPFPAGQASDTVSHIFGELFKMLTGVSLVHVPYRGGYVPDLLSGQVQVVFGTISSCIQYVRSGMLRALAVTSATRSDALPDIPALAEFVPGYEASQWYGIGAPEEAPADGGET